MNSIINVILPFLLCLSWGSYTASASGSDDVPGELVDKKIEYVGTDSIGYMPVRDFVKELQETGNPTLSSKWDKEGKMWIWRLKKRDPVKRVVIETSFAFLNGEITRVVMGDHDVRVPLQVTQLLSNLINGLPSAQRLAASKAETANKDKIDSFKNLLILDETLKDHYGITIERFKQSFIDMGREARFEWSDDGLSIVSTIEGGHAFEMQFQMDTMWKHQERGPSIETRGASMFRTKVAGKAIDPKVGHQYLSETAKSIREIDAKNQKSVGH